MSPRLSESQRAALEWMVAYPSVKVGWAGPDDWPMWTAAWANEDARNHMIGVMADLGDPTVARHTAPRTFPRGGTPRLTKPTFMALWRRGYVRVVEHRPAQGVWSEMSYWQISLEGTRALNPMLALVRGDLAI